MQDFNTDDKYFITKKLSAPEFDVKSLDELKDVDNTYIPAFTTDTANYKIPISGFAADVKPGMMSEYYRTAVSSNNEKAAVWSLGSPKPYNYITKDHITFPAGIPGSNYFTVDGLKNGCINILEMPDNIWNWKCYTWIIKKPDTGDLEFNDGLDFTLRFDVQTCTELSALTDYSNLNPNIAFVDNGNTYAFPVTHQEYRYNLYQDPDTLVYHLLHDIVTISTSNLDIAWNKDTGEVAKNSVARVIDKAWECLTYSY